MPSLWYEEDETEVPAWLKNLLSRTHERCVETAELVAKSERVLQCARALIAKAQELRAASQRLHHHFLGNLGNGKSDR